MQKAREIPTLSNLKTQPLDILMSLAKGYSLDIVGTRVALAQRIHFYLHSKSPKSFTERNGSGNKNIKDATKGDSGSGNKNIKDGEKGQRKRKRGKKKSRQEILVQQPRINETINETIDETEIQVELIPEQLSLSPTDPNYKHFTNVFEKFLQRAQNDPKTFINKDHDDVDMDLDTLSDSDKDEEEQEIKDPVQARQSKKKLRKQARMTVAQLKQLVHKPDVVEWVDVTSADPLLLVALKSTRNTVPVPGHWSKKSAYLSGKRGYEKPPFELPEYIKATGIMQIRQTNRGNITVQAKARERAHPKLGRLDIDYQKLHDAFFRFQTKPNFSAHGDVYFEGREFDSGLKAKKPGVLSDELKAALNIPAGAPPPWLINMQRYGPPPSYPQLSIAGLNAPIPEGAQWGFHAGGWGKPPTDEFNRPLYGDVFASMVSEVPKEFVAKVEQELWGELEEDEDQDEESDEDESEDESEDKQDEDDLDEVSESSVQFETGPIDIEKDHIELRKTVERNTVEDDKEKRLYTILEQRRGVNKGAFMASEHSYAVPSGVHPSRLANISESGIQVSLNSDDLKTEQTVAGLKRKQSQQELQSQQEIKISNKQGRKRDFKF